ncbi:MAG: hypothetical protein ACREFD_04955 [Stellaceae bacterium]
MASGRDWTARRAAGWGPRLRTFVLGTAAGMGIWLGLMGPTLPLAGPDLGKAIARAEQAPLRWIPKIWLAGISGRPDPIPPPALPRGN